jgi:hypothetical protein
MVLLLVVLSQLTTEKLKEMLGKIMIQKDFLYLEYFE